LLLTLLFFQSYRDHRDLHSFPTRRSSDLGTSKVPIIALTANATRKDIERCLDAGMNDCIPKPFAPEDLFRALFKYSNSSSGAEEDRKSTRLNSSHVKISYAVFCLKKKKKK